MARLQLKKAETYEDETDFRRPQAVKAEIEITVPLPDRQSLEQSIKIMESGGKWYATVTLNDHPGRDTPEEAVERLGEWLAALAKPMKKSHFKKFRLNELFKSKHI